MDKFNPFKLLSNGLISSLPFLLSTAGYPNAGGFVTKIQDDIKNGVATKESIKEDICLCIKAAEDFTNDKWDAVLEQLWKEIDGAFTLESLVETAIKP